MDSVYEKITDDTEFGVEFDKKSDIQHFFTGQTVFLTGGTGFLGKCFVEKLLRVCPDIQRLYMMVRPLRTTAAERMEQYFQDVLFDKLRKLRPNFKTKVTIMEGDVMVENLGLSEVNRSIIVNEVTMVVHAASNVKFAAPISKLLRTNVLGTQNTQNLAEKAKNLKIFVYVSTAYSHCYRQQIEDISYPAPADLKMVLDMIDVDEKTPGGISETARQQIQKPWPNMYTYSKAIAEALVEDFAKIVPFRCVIYRPSIVLSTYQEPIKGWIGNANGPTMMTLGIGLGYAHTAYKGDYTSDVVPADMCTNALFAIVWDAVVNRQEKSTVLIYNYASSTVNQVSATQMERYLLTRFYEMPYSTKAVQPYWRIVTNHKLVFWILHFVFHFLPAVLLDAVLLLTRQKPIGLQTYYKMAPHISWLLYFMNGNWRIQIRPMRQLWDRMSEADKRIFYSDLRTLDWEEYCYCYWSGIRAYLLRESITLDKSSEPKRIVVMNVAFFVLRILFIIWILFHFRGLSLLFTLPFYNLFKLSCTV